MIIDEKVLTLKNYKSRKYEYRKHTEPDAERDTGVLHSFHHSPG
jgi:hypothetical protein